MPSSDVTRFMWRLMPKVTSDLPNSRNAAYIGWSTPRDYPPDVQGSYVPTVVIRYGRGRRRVDVDQFRVRELIRYEFRVEQVVRFDVYRVLGFAVAFDGAPS